MNKEMDALYGNETWELAPLPKGKKLIGCRWVYKIKHNNDGSVSRYKARLVAKGMHKCMALIMRRHLLLLPRWLLLEPLLQWLQ
ncbi:hypothetical protein L7F22_004122 [Adiantum nelumboides]|nr:hypothetical protein [Adiantum nelumboides]